MGEIELNMEEKLKSSFSRAREHVKLLENEIKANREFIIKQSKQIEFILRKLGRINRENSKTRLILDSLTHNSSTGNEGVINNHQQSSTTINNQQSTMTNTSTTLNQQSTLNQRTNDLNEDLENEDDSIKDNEIGFVETNKTMGKALKKENKGFIENPLPLGDIKKEIEKRFMALTDREFSVFMAIYQLEEDFGEVTYSSIANALQITEITARCYVNNLLNRNIPIEKKRLFNRKAQLSIKKEFKGLNLASSLLNLRNKGSFHTQKKLIDNFN